MIDVGRKIPDDWWRPRSCTCSVWAMAQKLRFGGQILFIQNQRFPWLFRMLWRPAAQAPWYSYVPLRVPESRYRWVRNVKISLHSVWFRGQIRIIGFRNGN
jgi:hypothetical protein